MNYLYNKIWGSNEQKVEDQKLDESLFEFKVNGLMFYKKLKE